MSRTKKTQPVIVEEVILPATVKQSKAKGKVEPSLEELKSHLYFNNQELVKTQEALSDKMWLIDSLEQANQWAQLKLKDEESAKEMLWYKVSLAVEKFNNKNIISKIIGALAFIKELVELIKKYLDGVRTDIQQK